MSWLSYSSLIPPNLFILLTFLGVLLAWRRVRLGLVLATFGAVLLYLASMPIVADSLIWFVEALAGAIPNAPSDMHPGAIIVLSGDYRYGKALGEPDTVGRLTLERVAGAASEQRRTGLPILVSGGRPKDADDSLAGMMSTVLQNDFHVPVRWREDRSANTYQNAAFSAEVLHRAGVQSALRAGALVVSCGRLSGGPGRAAHRRGNDHFGELLLPTSDGAARQLLRAARTLRLWLVSGSLR
jgi:uncharacterized SAM-binding protein YcdF (DUF218 family)